MDNKGKFLLNRQGENIEVGFCFINNNLNDHRKKTDELHPLEFLYYKKLTSEKRRISYLLGRLSARYAIMEILSRQIKVHDYFIGFGVFKFPVVKNLKEREIGVSISHCDTLGVCIAYPEEHPMSIDIEKVSECNANAIKKFISPKEYMQINSCFLTKKAGRILIWTIKESISKILRTGLMANLKIFEVVHLKKCNGVYTSEFNNFFQYKAISKLINNHFITIVLPKNSNCDLDVFWDTLNYHSELPIL